MGTKGGILVGQRQVTAMRLCEIFFGIRVCTHIISLKLWMIVIHRHWRWIMRFDLSDEDWALLEPLLPKSRKSARVDDRKIMNAIFYVLRTGMPWRDLQARYGPLHDDL